jgi:hypothetical protein
MMITSDRGFGKQVLQGVEEEKIGNWGLVIR